LRSSHAGLAALVQVGISQRERTIGIRSTADGVVAHTPDDKRNISDARFDVATKVKTDLEMV
jgi:hypothetical protein